MKCSKVIKGILILLILLLLGSSGFLIYNLLLLNSIETFYRMVFIIFIALFDILIVISFISNAFKKYKKKKVIIMTIITIILTLIYGIGGYVIFTVYSKLANMNKDTVTYTSALITLNSKYSDISTLKNMKIGINAENKEDIEGYVIPQEMIKKYNLEKSNKIVSYDDDIDMMNDLYDGKINLAFVVSEYKTIYSNMSEFKDIKTKAILVKKQNKDVKKEQKKTTSTEEKGITKPFTILLLGVDSEYDGLNPKQAFNGDTIMLVSFNPETLNAAIFSIPRDTYVPIACNHNYPNKINSAAAYGTNCMINTVENFTGIDINYYAKINFKGVVELVDAVGGIDVDVPIKFCEQNSDRKKGKHKICLSPGKQHLDGEEALALARHRKTLPTGDFARGQNQQLVVEGLIDEIKNIKSPTAFFDILDAVSKNMDTDLTTDDMLSFYNIGKKMVFSDDTDTLNIQKTYLTGSDGHKNGLYIFNYSQSSLQEIIDAMNVTLGKKKAKAVKTFNFSINTTYKRHVAGDSEDRGAKGIAIVPDFTGKTLAYAEKWGKENGIKMYSKTGSSTKYAKGLIIDQSSKEGQFVSFMNGYMTVTVAG